MGLSNGLEIFENSLIALLDFDSEKVQLNFDGEDFVPIDLQSDQGITYLLGSFSIYH